MAYHYLIALTIILHRCNSACVKYSCIINNGEKQGTCQNYPFNQCEHMENCDGHCDNIYDRQCNNNEDCIIHSSPTPFPLTAPSPTEDICYHSTKECEALHHGTGQCFHDRLKCYRAGGTNFLSGLCGSGSCGCCVGFNSSSGMSTSTKIFIWYMVINALLILFFRYLVRRKLRIKSYEYDSEDDSRYGDSYSDDDDDDYYDDEYSDDDTPRKVKFNTSSSYSTRSLNHYNKKKGISVLTPVKELRTSLENASVDSDRIESMSLDRERKDDPNNRSFAKQMIEEEGGKGDDMSISTSSSNDSKMRRQSNGRRQSRSAPRPSSLTNNYNQKEEQQQIGISEDDELLSEEQYHAKYQQNIDQEDIDNGEIEKDKNHQYNNNDERDSSIYMSSSRQKYIDENGDEYYDEDDDYSDTSSMIELKRREERQRRLDLLCDDCCGDFEWWYASAWVSNLTYIYTIIDCIYICAVFDRK